MRKINRTQKKKDELQKALEKKRPADEPAEPVDEETSSSEYLHHVVCIHV